MRAKDETKTFEMSGNGFSGNGFSGNGFGGNGYGGNGFSGNGTNPVDIFDFELINLDEIVKQF